MATTQTVVLRLELQAAALERKLSATERRLKGFEGRTRRMGAQISSHFAAMFAVGAVIAFGKSQIELVTKIDASNRALKAITGSSLEYTRAKTMLRQSAEEFGVSILDLTASYVRFYAASKSSTLSTAELDDVFNKMTKSASVLGLTADETAGVLKALEQMFSKNKIQAEELRGQLGDRLPGAFVVMADSMGVTTAELDKMLKLGGVLSDEVLPNFATAYEKAIGADQIDKIRTLRSEVGRFESSWILVVESINGVEGAISNTVRAATDYMVMLAGLNDGSIKFLSKEWIGVGSTAELADIVREKWKKAADESAKLAADQEKFLASLLSQLKVAGIKTFRELENAATKTKEGYSILIDETSRLFLTQDQLNGLASIYKQKAGETANAAAAAAKEVEAEKKAFDDLNKAMKESIDIQAKMAGYELAEIIKNEMAAVLTQDEVARGFGADSDFDEVLKTTPITNKGVDGFMANLDAENPIVEVADEWTKAAIEIDLAAQAINAVIGDTLGNLAGAFGEALGAGNIQAFFDNFLSIIASGMVDMGKALIAVGLAESAFIKSFGAAKIPIGIALVALGSAFKNASAKTANAAAGGGSGGRGGTNRGFQNNNTGQSITVEGNFKLQGKDLVLALQNYGSQNSRSAIGG